MQSLQAAASVNAVTKEAVLLEDVDFNSSLTFSRKEVTDLQLAQDGILLIPDQGATDVSAVFSDEVEIKTASSGQQSAVLFSHDDADRRSEKEIPFVIVPVKTQQN